MQARIWSMLYSELYCELMRRRQADTREAEFWSHIRDERPRDTHGWVWFP